MAVREYITIADITDKVFNRFGEPTRQVSVDKANDICEDLAIKLRIDISDIQDPIHFILKDYLIHYAISDLALNNIGFNNSNGQQTGPDVYEELFKRRQYLMQKLKPQVTESVMTGLDQTPENRAVRSTRTVRG